MQRRPDQSSPGEERILELTETTPLLEVRNLTHIYGEGTPYRHVALEDCNLKIGRGELVGLIGHTGSGKSTLTQHCNGLLKPTSGQVLVKGIDIFKSKKATHEARFTVGLVMQYPEYQLFEETVRKDIAFGPTNQGLSGKELDDRIAMAAEAVRLPSELLDASPFELSGGEKRRAAIAGVIAMEPDLLILDEPTAGLDPAGRKEILELISAYRRREGKSILFVSHNMDAVAEICSRILVMNKSRLVMDGLPEEVFSRSAELREMGLALPEITEIFGCLALRGVTFDKPVYTRDYAVRKLLERFREGGNDE